MAQKQQKMESKAIKIEQQEEHDDAGKQQPKQPPRKVTRNRGGQKRDYVFVKSVKSVEQLDKIRFKQIYAWASIMPAENPPRIFRTEDNIEWTFLRTFADYGQMETFRCKIKCRIRAGRPGRQSHRRIRFPCCRIYSHDCEFQLLVLENTKKGYHVYTFGEHNHPAINTKPKKKKQPAACGHQHKQQGMEVDEEKEEEEEDDEDGQEENETEEGEIEEEDEAEEGNEEGEGQNKPIEEGDEEDDDVIVIDDDDEDEMIKVEQQQQEVKQEGPMEKTTETPLGNEATPRKETLKEILQKAQANGYYKWMAGIQPNQIETKLEEMDMDSVLNMVQMADQEIKQHPAAKFALWRPWLKHAIKKCMPQMEDFGTKYKDLIVLMMDHVQD